MDGVEKPRVKNPRRIITLPPEQIQQLLIAEEGHRNETLYYLAIATGLRQGEILGLKWTDVD
jgi:integrase